MKISARNRLTGKIIEVTKGATTAHVCLELSCGQVITASVTNERWMNSNSRLEFRPEPSFGQSRH
jgi:molybdopterin-binding protein